jgi:hypothetical protein
MGNIFTKPEAVLLDWNSERIGYSKRANTTDWCFQDKPKNFDYWFSEKRFTKISRSFYPQYKDGYIYGRTEDINYYKKEVDNYVEEYSL